MAKIIFGDLHVNFIANSSGIFTGDNRQMLWKHSRKSNDGFGSVNGDQNLVQQNTTVTSDRDFVDVVGRSGRGK